MLFFLIQVLIVSYSNKNCVLNAVFEYIKTCWKGVVAYCIYAICIVIPFFKLYIPVSKMFGKRTYGEIVSQLPELIDFFNVSTGNRNRDSFDNIKRTDKCVYYGRCRTG